MPGMTVTAFSPTAGVPESDEPDEPVAGVVAGVVVAGVVPDAALAVEPEPPDLEDEAAPGGVSCLLRLGSMTVTEAVMSLDMRTRMDRVSEEAEIDVRPEAVRLAWPRTAK